MAITSVRGGFKATYGGKTRTFKTRSAAENWAEKIVDPSSVVRKSDRQIPRSTGWAVGKTKKKTRSKGKSRAY